MSAIRRLAFVVLLPLVILYFGLRWIATGKSAIDGIEQFDKWGTR